MLNKGLSNGQQKKKKKNQIKVIVALPETQSTELALF